MLRRTVVAALLVYLTNEPLIATCAILTTTLAMLTYTTVVKPYKELTANNMAIANEVVLVLFTSGVFGAQYLHTDEKLGWALITFVLFAISANVIAMLSTTCIHLKALCTSNRA